MNQSVAKRPTPAGVVPLPKLSPMLDAAVDHALLSSEQPPLFMAPHVQRRIAEEARAVIPQVEARMQPAGLSAWDALLRPLIVTTKRPPSAQDFAAFVRVVADANRDIPAHLLTPARAREGVSRFGWFPDGKEVREWLEPLARKDRALLRTLEKIAADPEQSDAQRDQGEAVFAAVRATAAAFNAEVKAREKAQREAERITPAARYLSPTELRAALLRLVEGGGTAGQLAQCQLDTLEKNL